MTARLWSNIRSLKFAPELFLAGAALMVMLPSLGILPVSDDFSWLQLAKQGQSQSIWQYLSQPAPFGYFRPLPMLFFKTAWMSFGPVLWLYRITALLLHVLNVVLIYKLARQYSYSVQTSFLSSLIFALMPCHAEALFWLCSINELFSAFFILGGIYLYCSGGAWWKTLASGALFLMALLSRESAFCYIPFLLLFSLPRILDKWRRLALTITVPALFYVLFRTLWSYGLPESYIPPAPGQLDLNLLRMFTRLAQYFIKMLLPVKSLMEFFAFKPYGWFREIYGYPQLHPAAFWTTSIVSLAALFFVFYRAIKLSGHKILRPLLFSALALSVYLPFYNTGERFLYLPSIGAAVILAAWISNISAKKRKLGSVLLALILIVYGVSFGNRLYRWHQVGKLNRQAMANLEQRTEDLLPGSQVYLGNMPGLLFGIPFFSYFTFNHGWNYTFPSRKMEFYFAPAPRPANTTADLIFSPEDAGFKIMPRRDIP